MAEEQEKEKKKPKATLIKHRKKEEEAPAKPAPGEEGSGGEGSSTSEKKKVVVVKKKKAPKKKVVAKKSEPANPPDSSQEKPSAKEADADKKEKSVPPGKSPAASSGARPASGPRGQRAPSGQRKSYNGRSPNYVDHSSRSGSQDNRAGRPPARGGQPGRSPQSPRSGSGGGGRPSYGSRPGGGRPPQGPRAGGGKPGAGPAQGGRGTAPPVPDGKKSPRKFKSKKKQASYQKKKRDDKPKERIFQNQKKKPQQRTNPVPKQVDIMDVITVAELAKKMNLKASDLIGKLMQMGMMVTINQQIDSDTASILAEEYGCKVNIVSLYDETIIESDKDEAEDRKNRPAIITIMGHVDHGKTKLLDSIRTTDVVAGEFGGITQHIGAYTINTDAHGKLTFLDTPGHEAFTMMRSRGAQLTDIVVLIVAANDGVMPQTKEALDHAKDAGVPIIVAINKIDLPDANPDRVKQQLSEYELVPEDWGGKTQFVEISALKGEGIDNLLDVIGLEAEMLELKANYDCRAEGKIIESKVDQGRGVVSTVLVEKGTLRVGDSFVAGVYAGKIRALFNDRGEKVNEAPPSMPVEILGLNGVPSAGDPFQVTASDRKARQIADKRQELKKVEEARNVKKITLDNLYDSIQEGEVQELKVIIKGDVHGSVEALQSALEKLSTKAIRLTAIRAAAGAIIENDVYLAAASSAIIIGFHVRPTPKAMQVAEEEKVEIRKYNVIYDAVEDIKAAMEGMLTPDFKEEIVGNVEVRDTFKVPKIGVIAGCYVTSGVVRRKSLVHIYREGVEIHTGKIDSLKRFKDDAREVKEGYECGIGIEKFNDIKEGDLIEVYEMKEIAKKLEDTKKSG